METKVTTPVLAPVHTLVVVEVKATGRPEVAVAARAIGGTPKLTFDESGAGEVKLMVCAIAATPDTAKVPLSPSAALVAVMVVL